MTKCKGSGTGSTGSRKDKAQLTEFRDALGTRHKVYVAPLEEKRKGRLVFAGGKFMITGLQTYKVTRGLGLSAAARDVLDWLLENCHYENVVTGDWTQALIAKDCGLQRTYVSSLLGQLEDAQLICVIGRGICMVNPYLWFRGSGEQQEEAKDRWDLRMIERGVVMQPQSQVR